MNVDRLEMQEVAVVIGDRKQAPILQPTGGHVLHLAFVGGQLGDLIGFGIHRHKVLIGVLGHTHHAQPPAIRRPATGHLPCGPRCDKSLLSGPRVDDRNIDVAGLASVAADGD